MNRSARVALTFSLLLSPAVVSAQDALTAVHTAASVAHLTAFAAASVRTTVPGELPLELPSAGTLVLPSATVGAMTAFTEPVASAATDAKRSGTPWWAMALTVAGPLADGLSTMYAIKQSGPVAKVMEGNSFYHKLFGADVKPGEIMAFKVAQAAVLGLAVHGAGKTSREKAIGSALILGGLQTFVSVMNMRAAETAKRLNAGQRR